VLGALPAAEPPRNSYGNDSGNGNSLVAFSAATALAARTTTAAATATPEAAALASRTFSAPFGIRLVRRRARFRCGAFRTGRPLGPRWTLRTRRTFRSRRTIRGRLTFDARRTLGTGRAFRARRTVGPRRTFRARRTLRARTPRRTFALRPAFGLRRTFHQHAWRTFDLRSGHLAGSRAAATTPPSAAPCGLLFGIFARGRLRRTLLLLLLRGTLSLLLLLRRPLLPILRQTFSVAPARLLALLLAPTAAAALLFAIAAALLFRARRFAGPLFELADLFLHVAARLRVLLRAQLIVTAVRAALPPFRISALATCTEDGFRQRHRKRRALYTSACG
jgi:hypothetical protein